MDVGWWLGEVAFNYMSLFNLILVISWEWFYCINKMAYYNDDSDEEEPAPIVIDNGCGCCKAGFAGDDAPRSLLPSVLGRVRYRSQMVGIDRRDAYVGYEAEAHRGFLSLTHPMEHGIITNWDDMEKIWQYVFHYELRVSPEEHPVLLTEASLNPKAHRERMARVMFESFNVPAFNVANQCMLSMYASGRSRGFVIESGDGVTHTLPIYDGHAVTEGIQRIDLGGRDVTNYLARILSKKGHSFTATTAGRQIVRDIKEKQSRVSLNFDDEIVTPRDYQLPDGRVICLEKDEVLCAEGLFKPSLLGLDCPGIHQLIYDSIMKCSIDSRSDFFCNVILSGGNTMFENIKERLVKEIKNLAAANHHLLKYVRVVDPPERKYSAWIGGSILASLSTFQKNWITRPEYDEFGPSIVHRKVF